MAVLFVGSMFAADPKTSTLTFTKACGGSGVADDEAAWTITSDGTESTYDATKGIHYGTGSSAVGYIQLATSDIPGTITQVVVNASTANGVSASVTVKVGTTDFKTTGDATSIAATTTATDYTFTGSASGDIVVRLAKAASANKALYVKSVAVTYTEGGSEPTTQTLYLKISSDWEWPSKYAVYYFEDGKDPGWSSFMTAVDGVDNTYTTTIPLGYANVIFVRFNSAKESTGNWDDKWSQTVDLTIPTGKNHFTITSGGTGYECNGVWNVYPVVPTYYVKGTFVDDWATAYELEEGSYTFENLDAKWYAMKVTDGASEWYGIANLDTENSSKYIYGSDNIEFTLKEKGNVTVAFDSNTKKITVTGNFVAKTTTFTVNVPEGTDSVFVAGSWDGWTGFHKMEPVLGEDDQFKLTIDGEYADLEYKYLAGPNWKYAEDREDNRTWAALDNVTAWKAVPSFVKFAKVKAAPVNWTGHYIIAWGDLKPRSVVDATSTKDLVPADGAPLFVDGDTISVLEGSDYAVEIRFSETTGAYTVKLSDSKYLKNVSKAVNASDAAADLYLDFYKSETKEGVRIANADPADAASFILYKQNGYFRAYAGKIEDANYSLPTLYRLVDEPFDCLDGPYALLVNGKDIIPATKEAKEGYDEYAMYASLVKGDSVQVLNTSCGGLWLPTLEEAGAASHFAKGVAAATVDSTGCYDFYFKQIPSDQKMYIGFGICPDDTIRFSVRGKGGILGEDFEKAFDSKQDTLELDLEIGKYELKVQVGEDWKGFEQLTDTATGLTVGENGNICFQLKEAGNVKVVYNDSVFVLLGNFFVPTPHYYIAGTMTNWKDEMVELVKENADTMVAVLNLKGDYHYDFKLVYVLEGDTSWYGLGETATMVYGNSTGWWIYKSEGDQNQANVGLQTTKKGAYKFIFENKENFIISVVIPEGGSVVPEQATGMLDGFFSVSKDAKVQFSRGNLQYNVGAQKWYFAEKQYDLLGEDPNLNFGDENYKGALDLFSWSNIKSNYGLLVSNKDVDYLEGGAFQDWGALFAEEDWSTISRNEWNYILGRKDAKNNKLWTIIALVPAVGDTINGLVLFPDNWDVTTASDILYGFYNLDNETDLAKNTIELAKWETLETAGAVFLPMAGSRAGHIGCTNKGHEETTVKNPKCGWYCWVDNVNWYGYYWTNEMHAVNDTMAYYLIFPGWSEGPTLADEDDEWTAPVVWSREKRRGNSVRLVHKTYAPHYYVAGTMTNWKDEMVELLPLEEKADSLGVSQNLKADSLYAYKIVRVLGTDTAWYGLDGEATMEYGNSTGWYIYKTEGDKNQKNVGLLTTKEGDYPVTLVIKEDQLIVSVVIPKPDTKYYAKYADKAGEWNWKLLTEKEGKWLTDTIVYYGGGMNIHSEAEGDGKYFAEIAGVAAKDTAFFTFNPEDSTLVATVVGAYVVPIAEDGYYLVGTFNDWTPSAAYMFVANELKPGEFVLTATLAVDDEFKVVKCEGVNWTWYPAEGDNFVVMACYAGEKTMYFSPEVNTDWRLLGGHLYMDYTFKPGYYLVGSMTSWLPKSQYWIAEYVDDPPYVLETTLQVGWNIKVAKLEGTGETSQYYPDGEGNHYTVDEEHSGDVYFYFNPVYNGEWQNYWAAKGYNYGWWLMIEKKSTVDINITNDGVQAIKVLRDGQILIIKGEKTYNAQGQLVR